MILRALLTLTLAQWYQALGPRKFRLGNQHPLSPSLCVPGSFDKLALPVFTVNFEMDYNSLYSDEEEGSERLKPPKLGFTG